MNRLPDGYTQVTNLKTMQNMLRNLLRDFHEICEKHGLVYNLFCGTFLGAVRHQDIIPWDDDVDVTMPRPDYEKFLRIVEQEYSDSFFVFSYPQKNYVYPFAKFGKKGTLLIENAWKEKYSKLMLYIDIFPLDGVPEVSETDLHKRYQRARRNKHCVEYCIEKIEASPCWWKKPFVIIRWLRATLLNLFGYRYFLEKQIKETTRCAYDDCDQIGFISPWGYEEKGVCKKTEYLNRKLYRFGEYSFWGMQDYHTCLSSWYGDYMTPPPENKRSSPHNYALYVRSDRD